jgi:hypothetical protein
MREYLTKTVKIGDTIAVALPKELLAAEQITDNTYVKIIVTKCARPESDPIKNKGPTKDDEDPWRLLE